MNKIFLLLSVLLFLLTSCENKVHFSSVSGNDTDNETVDFNDDESAFDEDVPISTHKIETIIRYREDSEFEGMNRLITQIAEVSLETLYVNRSFNQLSTSFSLHPDDGAALVEHVTSLLPENLEECSTEPADATNFIKVFFDDESQCAISENTVFSNIDYYLIIPVHSMRWPFIPQDEFHPIGHSSISYQNYGMGMPASAYFHHGVDIIVPENSTLLNIYDGRVIKIDYYRNQEELYFEVVVKTVNGLIIQYHHTDPDSVPDAVYNLLDSDMILEAGDEVGYIVTWPVVEETYSEELFHHVHLNIQTETDIRLNGLQLLTPHADTTPPVIKNIYLFNENMNKRFNPESVRGNFKVAIEAEDFLDDNVWPIPPRLNSFIITDNSDTIVYEYTGYDFISMLSADEKQYACDYFLCFNDGLVSQGDYKTRKFYINISAFTEDGTQGHAVSFDNFEINQTYTLTVKSCDEYGNCSEKSKDFTIVNGGE